MDLKKEKYLVLTGVCGFIGSRIYHKLFRFSHHPPLILVDWKKNWRDFSLNFPHGLRDVDVFISLSSNNVSPHSYLPEGEASLVIHMGANSNTTETSWESLWTQNFESSLMWWKFCVENQVPFVYASSGSVYGLGEKGFKESISSEELHPLNPYGRSKLLFDDFVVKEYQKKKSPPVWLGLRFFNVYGPHEFYKNSMASVIHKNWERVVKHQVVSLFKDPSGMWGDGQQKRDFVFVDDIVRFLESFMENMPRVGAILNFGTGQANTWNEVIQSMFKSVGLDPKIEYIDMPEHLKNQYQAFTQADLQEFRKYFKEFSFTSIGDGLAFFLEDLRQRGLLGTFQKEKLEKGLGVN